MSSGSAESCSYLYSDKGNERFIPILLPGATEENIPRPLRDGTRYQPKTFDLNDAGYLALYSELTGQPAVARPPVGAIVPLPPLALPALPSRQALTNFPPADISRIIKYAPAQLIGREAETQLLNYAWAKAQNNETKRPHVLTFVALGGEGKTSAAEGMLDDLAAAGENVGPRRQALRHAIERVLVFDVGDRADAAMFHANPELIAKAFDRLAEATMKAYQHISCCQW